MYRNCQTSQAEAARECVGNSIPGFIDGPNSTAPTYGLRWKLSLPPSRCLNLGQRAKGELVLLMSREARPAYAISNFAKNVRNSTARGRGKLWLELLPCLPATGLGGCRQSNKLPRMGSFSLSDSQGQRAEAAADGSDRPFWDRPVRCRGNSRTRRDGSYWGRVVSLLVTRSLPPLRISVDF